MDQSKLFKAFERSKQQQNEARQRQLLPEPTPETESKPVKVLPRTKGVIEDLVPSEDVATRTDSIRNLKNPIPMALTDMRKNKLIYAGMKNRAVLNAYRDLRIQLMEKSDSRNVTVMLSSLDQDNHSIDCAMNLAIAFSLDINSSALLVDCNPYGTNLQKIVTSKMSRGITDYFQHEDLTLQSIIYASGIERVSVIPAGDSPSASVEQFSSDEMRNLIYELQNRYTDRSIIINAPPVLSNSEARVLSKYCDHTILTVPYGRSNVDSIEDAVAMLGASNVSGVVYQQ